MKLTFADVASRIDAVLAGSLSRLDADHWFIEMMDYESQQQLTFEPAGDEDRIKQTLWFLQALDLSERTGEWTVSDSDLRAALERMRPLYHGRTINIGLTTVGL